MNFVKKLLTGSKKGSEAIRHSLNQLIMLEQTLIKSIEEAEKDIQDGLNKIDEGEANVEKLIQKIIELKDLAIQRITEQNDRHVDAVNMAKNALGVIQSITGKKAE